LFPTEPENKGEQITVTVKPEVQRTKSTAHPVAHLKPPPQVFVPKPTKIKSEKNEALSELKDAVRVMDMFMRPKEAALVPFRSPLGNPPVSIARPFENLDLTGTTSTTPVLVSNALGCAVFRDPFRSTITCQTWPLGDNWNYSGNCYFPNNVAPIAGEVLHVNTALDWVSGGQPHGKTLYPGVLEKGGIGCFWVQRNQRISLTNQLGANCIPILYQYIPETGCFVDAANYSPTTLANGGLRLFQPQSTNPYGAYYGWGIANISSGASVFGGYVTVTVANDGSSTDPTMFAHRACKGTNSNIDAIDDYRITAASLLATNPVSMIARGGMAAMAQVPKDVWWYDLIGQDPFSGVASLNNAVRLCGDEGMYGYLKPSSSSDFEFANQGVRGSGPSKSFGFWYLDTDSEYLALGFTLANTATSMLSLQVTHIIEYKTTDVWRATVTPDISVRECELALEWLSPSPQFFSNALHWSDIGKFLLNVLKTTSTAIIKYGPYVLQAAKVISPIL